MQFWFEPEHAKVLERDREHSRKHPAEGYLRLAYDCYEALVLPNDRVGCGKGHPLGAPNNKNRTVWVYTVLRGGRYKICQECADWRNGEEK